jgi:mRNA-degrading endonuclease RelE of RelBE toxin-antitoxin system
MFYLRNRLDILISAVTYPVVEVKKRRKITADYITVFVNGNAQNRSAAVLFIPYRVIRPSSQKGNSKGRSSNNHKYRSLDYRLIQRLLSSIGFVPQKERPAKDRAWRAVFFN